MILADTSIWIDHFRRGNASLAVVLEQGLVATHPYVIGELACGPLARRSLTIGLLRALPAATLAAEEEVLEFIEARRIYGRGLGWTDAHLLAAVVLGGQQLWTLDRRLAIVARELSVGYS